ncbi:unnamed protein product (macronuclear) [Paramecium tetraurelia]|uniref:Uncharacterized protein n=1 Tax=Paramecium tetraurelia TaxID=5888 RepID=A0CBZ9_PARTE|nr:uncharacterized protein GSPATT00037100001 [Paramecium tetraurelia]CAK68316.1 unnamed protein product [Paramecium tetraurelia]|eukprot:XP_001435713.1 hypothetical protein (macronuclear) [Paramecium tetraurelia strain d4-2]
MDRKKVAILLSELCIISKPQRKYKVIHSISTNDNIMIYQENSEQLIKIEQKELNNDKESQKQLLLDPFN